MYIVGRTIQNFKIPIKYLLTLVLFFYNLKSTYSSVHEHVHGRQTTKFIAHEIK